MNNMINHHRYEIGDIALSCDINTSHDADDESKRAVSFLKVGDPAFIRRSDKVWRFATVSEVSNVNSSSNPFIVFIVTKDGSTKKVGMHHWGDRVRTLQRHAKRRNVQSYLKQKGLRTSCDTQTTSPADSQSSADLTHSASQAQADKSSDEGYSTTDNEPTVPSRQEGPPTRRLQRRGSLKQFVRKVSGGSRRYVNQPARRSTMDMDDTMIHAFNDSMTSPDSVKCIQDIDEKQFDMKISKPDALKDKEPTAPSRQEGPPTRRTQRRGSFKQFVRNVSGGSRRHVNQPARRSTMDMDDMKIHEFNDSMPSPISVEGTQDIDEKQFDMKITKPDATKPIERNPSRRQNSANNVLTTSSLFKNLMKGAILSDDKESPEEPNARRSTVADLTADDDNIAPLQSNSSSRPKRRLARRSRRATVDTGAPSAEMMNDLRRRHHRGSGTEKAKAHSNDNSPTASFVMRGAFAQLMQEKCESSKEIC